MIDAPGPWPAVDGPSVGCSHYSPAVVLLCICVCLPLVRYSARLG